MENVVSLNEYDSRKTTESIIGYYKDLNWFIIPLKYGTKQPIEDDWNDKPLDHEALEQFAKNPINLGVLLGKRVIDIDLDCEESRALAEYILPPSLTFGRDSTPKSHYVYSLSSCGII